MNKYTNHEIADLFPMMLSEELASLTENIKTNGFSEQTPILLYEDKILDGRNRYTSSLMAGVEPLFAQYTGHDPMAEVIRLNLERRHLTAGQKAILAVELLPKIQEEAKKRQVRKPLNSVSKILSEQNKGKSTEKAAKLAGSNSTSVSFVKKLKVESPTVYAKVKSGGYSIEDAKRSVKIEKNKQDIALTLEKIETENIIITDKFDVVVIDPPWPYGRAFNPETSRVASPYPEMSIEAIADIKLPIKEDTAVVFLWTTHAFLYDAFQLLEKWNLKYKATMVWDKELLGMGDTIRMQCEFCLLAIKGKPIIQGSSQRDIIREARREHSRKPEAFYKMVEDITMGSRLDYFARQQRKGWIAYGAETTKF